jgi:hypothetical protein
MVCPGVQRLSDDDDDDDNDDHDDDDDDDDDDVLSAWCPPLCLVSTR